MGEQAVRIDLVARGGGMAWGEPRLMVPGSVPAAAARRTFDHIYVWMIDTLRADKVRAYNPKTNVSDPQLRRLRRGRHDVSVGASARAPGPCRRRPRC